MNELTNEQLQELMADPRFTNADLEFLTPGERSRFMSLRTKQQQPTSMFGTIEEVLDGFLKSGGQTIFSLGQLANSIPGLGDVTGSLAEILGPEGTDADKTFSDMPQHIEHENTAERVGGAAEQIAEFFVPAGPAKHAAIGRLVRMIPDNATPQLARRLNRAGAVAGRSIGEGASASAVSALHDDPQPEIPGAMAAAGPPVGAVAKELIPRALGNPVASRILPVAAGGMTVATAGDLLTGLGSAMGIYGLGKAATQHAVDNPRFLRRLGQSLEQGSIVGSRTGAGLLDQLRARRRRLNQR